MKKKISMHDLKKEEMRRIDAALSHMKNGKAPTHSGEHRMALMVQHVSYIRMPLSEKDGYIFDYDTCTLDVVSGKYYSSTLGHHSESELTPEEIKKILKLYKVDPKSICYSIVTAGLPVHNSLPDRQKIFGI